MVDGILRSVLSFWAILFEEPKQFAWVVVDVYL